MSVENCLFAVMIGLKRCDFKMRSFLKRSNFIRSEKYCSLLEKLEARNLIALCDETIST